MNTFLQNQYVKNENRRKKTVRRLFLKVRQVSLIILIWSICVGSIYGLYRLIFEESLFIVKNIEIDGVFSHLTRESIVELSGIKLGTNIFSLNIKNIQRELSKNPWVKEVAVTRKPPSTIWIFINEQRPYVMVKLNDLYLANEEGVVFKGVETSDDKDLPVLTGDIDEENLSQVIEVLRLYIGSRLADYYLPSEVNFSKECGYSIVLEGEGVVLRFGYSSIQGKMERLYEVLGALDISRGKMRYVDLNIPGKVVVKYEI